MKCCDNCLFIVEYIPVLFYTDRVPIFTSTRRNNKRGDDLLFLLSKFFFSLTGQKTQVRFSDKKKNIRSFSDIHPILRNNLVTLNET